MTINIVLIIIVVAILVLISIVSNHIVHKLNRIEDKLISIGNDIKYNQYLNLINTQDNNSYPDNDKDIRVVIYSNGKEIYEYKE